MLAGASPIIVPRRPSLIGMTRKSTWDPDRAIGVAMAAAAGNPHPCPVVHQGKILGIIRGEGPFSPRVKFRPTPYRLGYADYNDLVSEFVTKGKWFQATAYKTANQSLSGGRWVDMWTCAGGPTNAPLTGAAATANAYDDTSAFAMLHGGNVSPDTKYVLSMVAQAQGGTGCLMLYDRVLDYQSCVYTAAANQNMTNVAVAARYASAGQFGLQMTWGADSIHDATASNVTVLTYVDQDGNASNMPTTSTVAIIVSAAASSTTSGYQIIAPALGTTTWGFTLPVEQTDTGARSVTNYTTSAVNTGTFVLALIYPLAYLPWFVSAPVAAQQQVDQLFHLSCMERVYDGACLAFMAFRGNGGGLLGVYDALMGWG